MADPVSLGIQLAITAASMAVTASQKIEGPRNDNLKFSGGDPGAPWPMIWGMRRTFGVPIWARDLQEVKQRRKTKGGKYNDYTYFADFAVGLTSHQIDAVRRMWADKKLVYDMSGAGPVTPLDLGSSTDISSVIAIYLGTADQDPDPYMQGFVEADLGEGFCPAYRNRSYVVFKHLPVEKFGNRFPQVEFEVVRNTSAVYPTDTVTVGSETNWLTFSGDYSSLVVGKRDKFTMVDAAAKKVMYEGRFSPVLDSSVDGLAYLGSGTILGICALPSFIHIRAYPQGGGSYEVQVNTDSGHPEYSLTQMVGIGSRWLATPLFSGEPGYFNGNEIDMTDIFDQTVTVSSFFTDLDGHTWLVGVHGTKCYFYRPYPNTRFIVTGLASNGGNAFAVHYRDATHDQFVISWSDGLHAIDRTTGAQVASNTSLAFGGLTMAQWLAIRPGASTIWCGFEEINLSDLTSRRVLTASNWGVGLPSAETVYDPINHALITRTTTVLQWNYLDRVGTDATTLGDIEADIADLVGVLDYDFSAHTQLVPGWSITQGQASNAIEPLHNIYDCTIRPHDFTLQGINYSGTSLGTILTERFVANDPRYTVTMRQAAELPRAVTVNFSDIDHDQQTNNVRSERPLDATGAKGEQSLDLTTYANDVDTIRGYADRYFRRMWNERREVSLSLTAQQLALEPGDCRTLSLDGESAIYRCVKATIRANDEIATEWKYDHPSLAVIDGTAGAAFDREETVIAVPLLSKGFFLDTPYISDVDDQSTPIIYVLAAPYVSGVWPGAVAYQAVDGEYTEEIASVPSSSPATWGYVTEEFAYTNPNLWDRVTELTVTLQTGTLTGTTEAAIDANPELNLAAIGGNGRWEFVQFAGATLTAPNTYTISDFKRGRRGTEWAAELHEENDQFVLLETATNAKMGLSEVGTDLSFEAITAGRTSAFPIDVAPFTGASLKPYAPANVHAVKQSNGDWIIYGIRRTRIGGAWTSGTSIPLGEASEAYEIDVSDGVNDDTISTASLPYTWTVAAQIASDIGGEVAAGDLSGAVYQISDAVDRGFAAAFTA